MRWWFRRRTEAGHRPAARRATQADEFREPLLCATCGRPLGGDPDDEPDGDAGHPICGECDRQRDFDAMDVADGTADGRLG